jgi:hypothetical protein
MAISYLNDQYNIRKAGAEIVMELSADFIKVMLLQRWPAQKVWWSGKILLE